MTHLLSHIERALALHAGGFGASRLIFSTACDAWGLGWTTLGRTVYVSRKADVEKMDRFIGPKA